jgi:hypothetical protein
MAMMTISIKNGSVFLIGIGRLHIAKTKPEKVKKVLMLYKSELNQLSF